MRVADRPLPSVVIEPLENEWPASWPVRPVLAIEQQQEPPYTWDAGFTWDDPTPLVWDYTKVVPTWRDATCELISLELETGNPDEHGNFDTGQLVAVLDNSSGAWSAWNADGTPARNGPGNMLALWARTRDGSQSYWLASMRIARWSELAGDLIEVEAFDAFSDLAQPIGSYTPGLADDTPGMRLEAIRTAAALTTPRRFAGGQVRLTRQLTEDAPLEEMQTVQGSDGGVLYVDADGTLTSYDRSWRAGRTDQTAIPVVADNVCAAPVVVWEAVLASDDDALADTVILENVARLRATATSAPNAPTGRYVLSETRQQWTTQAEGDTLASFLLAQQQRPRLRVESFDVYVLDPQQAELWRAVEWRLFDRLRFLHDTRAVQGVLRLDVFVLITSLAHSISADNWVMTVGTSRVVSYTEPPLWDSPLYVWDSPNPLAVWGF